MTAFVIPILISLGVSLLRYGITALYEARKMRRPNIRDKEGTRVWLENLLRWAAYLQKMFFADLATPAFTLGILLELVKPGAKWDALYAAITHDFNISTTFPPNPAKPVLPGTDTRETLVKRFALRIRNRFGNETFDETRLETTPLEMQMAEEYLAVIRRLMEHPAVFNNARQTFAELSSTSSHVNG